MASKYDFCDRVIADGFSFGVVMGILSNLSLKPTGKATVQLVAHQIAGKKQAVWLDSIDILVGDARNAIAEALQIIPASRVSIESGKGSLLDDLNVKLFPFLSGSSIDVNLFGFTTVSCYINVKEEEESRGLQPDETVPRDRSSTHFRALIGNIKGEARYGHHLTLTAKVATATAGVRGLFVSPIEKFAAAAPIHQLAVPSILSSAMYVRMLSWNAVNAAAAPSVGGSELGDTSTAQSELGDTSTTPAQSRSRGLISSASRLYKSAFEPSEESIKNGDLVVIECDGKFMSVTRGWWMAWSSTAPRRSGAFRIEILERNETIFENSLRNIKEQFSEKFNASGKLGTFSVQNHLKQTDGNLRTGDSFRLRSVKFPEYEMGVTSVKLKDEFCYVGLRKVDGSSSLNEANEEWCVPMRFSVKVSHLSNKMFKM
eukprot:CAMPEP_0119044460 /NCGR_PEP_ID=MMETSP1177-20130426/31605_1 /TAXON_ID=2985 /ORGANISM="Ochromonas sp, Strain CCMP1899" /LENGTH=428 /DNA_ID=CAMNT_0007014583 /DNA_START=166 /DNA_END=1452 /DNA_ORIENTATION=+